ncbi:uncharacterized protein [Dermacentor albipictus]|uniref:uncharacterized protein isoform X2 n=1 Tax=Dermacentor albipictus TaxID=60249 RepID=UPI0031FBE66D
MLTMVFFLLGAYALSPIITSASCPENDDGWPAWWLNLVAEQNCATVFKNSEDKIEQDIKYYNKSSQDWRRFHKTYKVTSWATGETARNYFESPGPTGKPLNYLVLLAAQDCLVAKLLYRSNVSHRACEFLVTNAYFENSASSQCCDNVYATSCEKTAQVLYHPGNCSALEKNTKG